MNQKYLEVLKFRLYPTKEEKKILDREIRFYERYKLALLNEIKRQSISSFFEPTETELEKICDSFKTKIKSSSFPFSKYYANNHFSYAKENVIKSIIYKKKKNIKKYPVDRVSIKISDSSCYLMYGKLYLKNGVKIKIKPYVEILDSISFINLTRTNGIYFISVSRYLDVIKSKKTNSACGIDVGFSSFATIYDTEDKVTTINFENHKVDKLISKANFYKRTLVNIESKNKDYLKSNNYKKVLQKMERTYQKISNIRAYFFSKVTNELLEKYDLIVVEHLSLESLFRNRESRLNLQKNSFGVFFKTLEDKAKKYDKKVIRADRFFMSSKICSECGLIHNEMKDYTKRDFECECGYKADRDVNAARNLLMYGLKMIRNESFKNENKKKMRSQKFNY